MVYILKTAKYYMQVNGEKCGNIIIRKINRTRKRLPFTAFYQQSNFITVQFKVCKCKKFD